MGSTQDSEVVEGGANLSRAAESSATAIVADDWWWANAARQRRLQKRLFMRVDVAQDLATLDTQHSPSNLNPQV